MNRGQANPIYCPRKECLGSQIGILILEEGGWQLWKMQRRRDKGGPGFLTIVDSRIGGLHYFDITEGQDSRQKRGVLLGMSDRGPAIDLHKHTGSRREWVRRFGDDVGCADPEAETFTLTCRRCKHSVELQRAALDRGVAA